MRNSDRPKEVCDIAFGPGGEWGTDLFVVDPVEGKIYKVDSIGNVSMFISGLSGPEGLVFDSKGTFGNNLYVGEVNISTISKVDSNGNKVHFASGFGGDPHVLVFGPGGAFGTDLYITNDWKGNILKVDSNGNFTVFASGFGRSAGIAFDASGNLFIADEDKGDIIKISPLAYTQEQMEEAVLNERLKWDINGDNKKGLEEVIDYLQVLSGLRNQ